MKQVLFSILFISSTFIAFAQEENTPKRLPKEEESGHFRRDNIFIGGGVGLGYSSNFYGSNFNFGITPEIGYSFTNWFDAGVSINLNYYSYNSADGYGGTSKQRSFNYGGGTFLRAYPLREFFIQLLPEYNFISTNLTSTTNNQTLHLNQHATSFLAGVGYGRRIVGQSGFYTVLMLDLASDAASPYRQASYDAYGNSSGSTYAIPVIRAGFTFYLRPKKQK